MFGRLGGLISRYWMLVILGWGALAIGLHAVAPRWDDITHDGDLAYLPATMPSVEGEVLLSKAFPGQIAKSQIGVVIERPEPFTAADLAWVDGLAERFENLQDELPILEIWTHDSDVVGAKLISRQGPSGQATVILLHLSNEFMATDNLRVLGRVNEILDDARRDPAMPQGLELGVTGSAAIGGDMVSSAAESIKNTELTTVLLVVAILLVVYRAPVMIIIPLATIGLALFVSTDLLALLTQLDRIPGFDWWNFKIFKTTKIFIIVILFGAGTDFCLFLISRYKEELERGFSRAKAAAAAVSNVGTAIVGSALTTIFGLGMMYFAAFGKFRNSGPAIALCLAVTLCACLTLAPALLRACGGLVFWPFGLPAVDRRQSDPPSGLTAPARFGGFWNWASRAILARPGLILVASVLLLAPVAWFGISVPLTYDFLSELQPNRPSVIGTAMARRHFAAGETTPVTLMALKEQGHFDTPAGEKEIAKLTKFLYDQPGVARVRSITEPLGDKPGLVNPLSAAGRRKIAARKHSRTREHFISQVPQLAGDVALFEVVLQHDPFSIEAMEVVNRLDGSEGTLTRLSADADSYWHNTRFAMVGTTVGVRDLKAVTESDQTLIEQLVVLAVLGVLMVILRRPLVCVYLILSVLLSYFVTIGATHLFFAWLCGPTYPGLDWKVPIFLFVILIAVGEDYNIYLMTRVIEEQRRLGAREGLRVAVARTGGIITSCGVIMAGTFVSMMTGTLRGVQELGFSLSLGVMLDTCIVRPVLVPAFMALLIRKDADAARELAQPSPAGRGHLPTHAAIET